MDTVLSTITITFSLASIACLAILFTRRNVYFGKLSTLPHNLTLRGLGKLEAQIVGLEEVIIVASVIEFPEGELYEAVKNNLIRDVEYKFFVSRSNLSKEINTYYGFYKAIERMLGKSGLVTIRRLGLEWTQFPYIFYRSRINGESVTFAYRGTQEKEGIAESYTLIEPDLAMVIVGLVNANSAGQEKIEVVRSEFSTIPNTQDEINAENSGIVPQRAPNS